MPATRRDDKLLVPPNVAPPRNAPPIVPPDYFDEIEMVVAEALGFPAPHSDADKPAGGS